MAGRPCPAVLLKEVGSTESKRCQCWVYSMWWFLRALLLCTYSCIDIYHIDVNNFSQLSTLLCIVIVSVNMSDPIREHFDYGQLWSLWPVMVIMASVQPEFGRIVYMPDPTSRIRFSNEGMGHTV